MEASLFIFVLIPRYYSIIIITLLSIITYFCITVTELMWSIAVYFWCKLFQTALFHELLYQLASFFFHVIFVFYSVGVKITRKEKQPGFQNLRTSFFSLYNVGQKSSWCLQNQCDFEFEFWNIYKYVEANEFNINRLICIIHTAAVRTQNNSIPKG